MNKQIEVSVKLPIGTTGTFFEFKPESVREGLYNLNSLYQQLGSPSGKEPRTWARKPSSKTLKSGKVVTQQGPGWDFISTLAKKHDVSFSHIVQTSRGGGGGGGGTLAHYQVYMAYATYLSPEVQIQVNEIVVEAMNEAANPGLKMSRAIEAYKKLGYSDEWINDRLQGKLARNDFTAELKKLGIDEPWMFADCTNTIYKPLYGGDAKELRRRMGFTSSSQQTRDGFNRLQLQAGSFAEICAITKLHYVDGQDYKVVRKAMADAGKVTDEAIRKLTGSNCHVQPKKITGF